MSVYSGFEALTGNYPEGLLRFEQDSQLINESLYTILRTRIGERVELPTFGSLLPTLVFEQGDGITISLAKSYSVDAITTWEPRVQILDSSVTFDNVSTLTITINYLIIKLGQTATFIYTQEIPG